jgi:hypothetical protein
MSLALGSSLWRHGASSGGVCAGGVVRRYWRTVLTRQEKSQCIAPRMKLSRTTSETRTSRAAHIVNAPTYPVNAPGTGLGDPITADISPTPSGMSEVKGSPYFTPIIPP